MSILNKLLYGLIAVLLVVCSLSLYSGAKLQGKVNTLEVSLSAAQAQAKSLEDALKEAKVNAVKNNDDSIKKSTQRAVAKSKIQAAVKESRNEAVREAPLLLPDIAIKRLQELVSQANSIIRTPSNTK